jgi:DNA-directed RNA polymerase subunit M/transcription elongation factor TFIIS
MDSNRHFRSQSFFANHKMKRGTKKNVCDRKRVCPSCNEFIKPYRNHECGKRYCETCKAYKEKQHLCYMQPLKNVLPSGDGVMFVFFDFETTQVTQYSDTARLRVPNLVCEQQFSSLCESSSNVDKNCTQCGTRKHSFWEDPVGDLLSYLCEDRPWCKQIIVITHNAKAFDLHFILKRAIFLKWQLELIMSGEKIMCMKMELLKFIESICFLPFHYASY